LTLSSLNLGYSGVESPWDMPPSHPFHWSRSSEPRDSKVPQ